MRLWKLSRETLWDRLVCGLKSELVQKKLLSEKDLTLAKALDVAQAMEAADASTKEMKGTFSSVLRVETLCYRCGDAHDAKTCRFKEAKCHKCQKLGHIAKVCRSKKPAAGRRNAPHGWQSKKREEPRVKYLESEIPPTTDTGQQDLSLFTVGNSSAHTIRVEVKVNDTPLVMEVDTGAAVSLLSEETFKSKFPGMQLHPTSLLLKTYTGEPLDIVGELPVEVEYQQQGPKSLSLVIVKDKGPPLFGRNWLHDIRLDWQHIASVVSSRDPLADIDVLLEKYVEVFSEELSTIKSFKAKLLLKEGARPKFCRAWQVPYAMKAVVEEELDRLES